MAPLINFHSGTLYVNWGPLALEVHWMTLALALAVPIVAFAWVFARDAAGISLAQVGYSPINRKAA